MKKGIIFEYSFLRVLSIIFVVLGHSCYLQLSTSEGWLDYSNVINYGVWGHGLTFAAGWVWYVCQVAVPLFFFLSGAIYRHSMHRYGSFVELFESKFKRLVIPYIGISLLFMIPMKFMGGFYPPENIFRIILTLPVSLDESGHLWFLPMLFFAFLTFYWFYKYAFSNYIIVGLVTIYIVLCPLITSAFLKFILLYMIYFVFGFLFEGKRVWLKEQFFKKKMLYLCAISIAYYFIWQGIDLYSGIVGSLYNFIFVAISSCFWIVVCLLATTWKVFTDSKFIQFLDSQSFNIYLFHEPFNCLILLGYSFYIASGGVCSPVSLWILYFCRTIGVSFVAIVIGRCIYDVLMTKYINNILRSKKYTNNIFVGVVVVCIFIQIISAAQKF